MIHAFISSRLDYCNLFYLGLFKNFLAWLQLVQNAKTRLMTGTRKCISISLVRASVHWLFIEIAMQCNMLLMFFKEHHGLAPSYIYNLLQGNVLQHHKDLPRILPFTVFRKQGWRLKVAMPFWWQLHDSGTAFLLILLFMLVAMMFSILTSVHDVYLVCTITHAHMNKLLKRR